MKRLIVIEGYDRSGKDTLMQDLEDIKVLLPNTYIYFNDLEGLPKYDKEQENFLDWLNRLISKQISELNKLFEEYDNIIMTRLIVSDEVYSKLFNREHTTIKYIDKLNSEVKIINYCLLFNSFKEYLNRLFIIDKNLEPQYNLPDFMYINELYKNEILKYKGSRIYYIFSNTSRLEILKDFINHVYKKQ